MKKPALIDLRALGSERHQQIAAMTDGLENPSNSHLWTVRLRPVLRGGKAWVGPTVQDCND